jgi:hypothetical protein
MVEWALLTLEPTLRLLSPASGFFLLVGCFILYSILSLDIRKRIVAGPPTQSEQARRILVDMRSLTSSHPLDPRGP